LYVKADGVYVKKKECERKKEKEKKKKKKRENPATLYLLAALVRVSASERAKE